MPEDTAVLDTAAIETEAPGEPVIEQESAETEPLASTETEDTEPSPPSSPFEGMELDEIEKDPNVAKLVKDRLARKEESLRQSQAAAQQRALSEQQQRLYLQRRQQIEAANTQWAAGFLKQVTDRAVAEGEALPAEPVAQVAQILQERALVGANESVVAAATAFLNQYHPDFRVPLNLNQAYATAQANLDVPGQVMATIAILDAANRERLTKEIRAQVEKEFEEQASKEGTVAKEREAAKAAKSSPRPTGTPAQAPPARPVGDIVGDPTVPWAEKNKAFMAAYGMPLPR